MKIIVSGLITEEIHMHRFSLVLSRLIQFVLYELGVVHEFVISVCPPQTCLDKQMNKWRFTFKFVQFIWLAFVTWARDMGHMSANSISIFQHSLFVHYKCYLLFQTPLKLDMWLLRYGQFLDFLNDVKHRNLLTVS